MGAALSFLLFLFKRSAPAICDTLAERRQRHVHGAQRIADAALAFRIEEP